MSMRTLCCKADYDYRDTSGEMIKFCTSCQKDVEKLEDSLKEPYDIKFELTKDEYWDNWGRSTKVFRKGDLVEGTAYLYANGDIASVWAESTICDGVSDQVSDDCIKVISITKKEATISEDIHS